MGFGSPRNPMHKRPRIPRLARMHDPAFYFDSTGNMGSLLTPIAGGPSFLQFSDSKGKLNQGIVLGLRDRMLMEELQT